MRAVLTYHSIDGSGSPISVTAAEFRAHVAWLASGRVRVVPLDALLGLPDEVDAVALTFDDGFRNVQEHALPLLRAHALPATVFVVSDRVGAENAWEGTDGRVIPRLPLMDWEALGRAREDGVEIGAHTRRHPALSRLAPAALVDEIDGAAERIARELGTPPRAFAYPYGDAPAAAVAHVRARYALGCTTSLRVLRAAEDAARVPRLDMYYFRQPGRLGTWGRPAFRHRLWWRRQGRALRGAARRLARLP